MQNKNYALILLLVIIFDIWGINLTPQKQPPPLFLQAPLILQTAQAPPILTMSPCILVFREPHPLKNRIFQ